MCFPVSGALSTQTSVNTVVELFALMSPVINLLFQLWDFKRANIDRNEMIIYHQ